MARLLYVVFFVSGLAGLVYETIWTRYLSLFLGHSAYAQVLVLTIFLGGLSVGAFLAGQRSERLRRPLLWYAVIEGGVGLLGLLFHDIYLLTTGWAYEAIFPFLSTPFLNASVRWAMAGALILPQSILLGTTFPLMSAALLRRKPDRPGHTLALLYFSNSLGAAAGALLTGFVLVGWGGLPGALLVAGSLNILVGGAAYMVFRASGTGHVERLTRPAAVPREDLARLGETLWRGLLIVAFGTALASFIYEIVWIRMLSLVLGSTTHAFELMLSAFILGLALGALWIRRRVDTFQDPLRALAVIQWCMGLAALATLPIYAGSFEWMPGLVQALQPTEAGYRAYSLARYGMALAVMLPSTFCAGMTLPLITRILVVSGQGERAVGWVYGINTLGSIAGVGLAGLLLLPLLGLKLLLVLGGTVDMLIGVGILLLVRPPRASLLRLRNAGLAATLAVVLLAVFGVQLDRALMTSDLTRTASLPRTDHELLYYQDGRTATVTVGHADGRRWIATNGKTDASIHDWLLQPDTVTELQVLETDEVTQLLLAVLPLAHQPRARRAAVVGIGSGMTSHNLLGSAALEEIVTIEIEPAMIEGAREFYPANERVFDDPRSRFVIDDARAVLASRPERFDIIVSEPSNPWVSGISSLFTREFYTRARDRLAPGGIFCQWLQVYSIDEALVLSVLAAVHEVFPSYRVYRSTHDLIIVAGESAALPAPDWSVLQEPGLREDLERVHPVTPVVLEALTVADRPLLGPLLDRWGTANSDFYPVLDLGSEKARFMGRNAYDFLTMGSTALELASLFLPGRAPASPETAPFPQIPQVVEGEMGWMMQAALGGSDGSAPSEATPMGRVAGQVYEVRRFQRAMGGGTAPTSWPHWTQEAERVAGLVQQGRSGEADDNFFGQLDRYAGEAGAPDGVRQALRFLRAYHAQDLPSVVEAGRPLLAEVEANRSWLATGTLLHALVTAELAAGNVEEARAAFEALRKRIPGTADLRMLVLDAHLQAAAAGGSSGALPPQR